MIKFQEEISNTQKNNCAIIMRTSYLPLHQMIVNGYIDGIILTLWSYRSYRVMGRPKNQK